MRAWAAFACAGSGGKLTVIASRPQPGGFVEETPGSSRMRRMSAAVSEVRSACASGRTGHLKDPVVQPCVAMDRLIGRQIRNALGLLWNFGAGGEDRTPDIRLNYRCFTVDYRGTNFQNDNQGAVLCESIA